MLLIICRNFYKLATRSISFRFPLQSKRRQNELVSFFFCCLFFLFFFKLNLQNQYVDYYTFSLEFGILFNTPIRKSNHFSHKSSTVYLVSDQTDLIVLYSTAHFPVESFSSKKHQIYCTVVLNQPTFQKQTR